jgi:3-oxoadipate enol-lactonase
LVHGYTANRTVWCLVEGRLGSDEARLYTLDLRGHGESSPLRAPTTAANLADDIAAAVDELDLRSCVLVGHSLGGMLLQLLAARRPDLLGGRVRALLLVNTTGNPSASRPTRLIGTFFQSRAFDGIAKSSRLRTMLARSAFPSAASADATVIQASIVPPARSSRLHFDVRSVPDMLIGNAGITVPVTVLASTHDVAIPTASTAALAESIPHARLRILPGTGHLLPLERPDVVADEIRRLMAHTHDGLPEGQDHDRNADGQRPS